MFHIPGDREVERCLKESQGQVKSALKEINAHVGRLLGKGDYAGAETLIAVAKKVGEFEAELVGTRKRWRAIAHNSTPSDTQKEKAMPLWQYYAPTLKTILHLGGTAKKEAIEQEMGTKVSDLFPPSEVVMKGKRPRWAEMMRRALGAMEKEGFVQRIKSEWRITPSGRKATENSGKDEQS